MYYYGIMFEIYGEMLYNYKWTCILLEVLNMKGHPKKEPEELVFYTSGEEVCLPGHGYGPGIRDHYLIHFVTEGKGTFEVGQHMYHVKKGQAFLICPNVITYYRADDLKPWSYMWIGFAGHKAATYLQKANLDKDHLIFSYKIDAIISHIQQINAYNRLSPGRECIVLGHLYAILGQMIEDAMLVDDDAEYHNDYVKEAKGYIDANYSRDVTVNDIAAYLSINRSYLYALFIEEIGQSPKTYLTQYRLQKAHELMKNPSLNIAQIARSVGYKDPLTFSKVFKKHFQMSPKHYRRFYPL